MIATAPSIDYLDQLPDDRRHALMTIRNMIHAIWPDIVEDMSYGIPTFHLNGKPLCSIANLKHFMAVYIAPYDLLDAFKNDLRVHDHGKSCIRFKHLDPAMLNLLDRVIKYTGEQQDQSTLTTYMDPMRQGHKRAMER